MQFSLYPDPDPGAEKMADPCGISESKKMSDPDPGIDKIA